MVAIDATANAMGCQHNLTSIHNHKEYYQLFHTQNANAWEEYAKKNFKMRTLKSQVGATLTWKYMIP
jgi:hypothetical protein